MSMGKRSMLEPEDPWMMKWHDVRCRVLPGVKTRGMGVLRAFCVM